VLTLGAGYAKAEDVTNLVKTGTVRVDDVDVAYDVRGAGEPLLLIAGYSMTRVMWDEELCDRLASRGFEVARIDNRDTGASTRMQALGVPNIPRMFARSLLGLSLAPAYTLEDMSKDALGVMSHLGHERFHVVGASMGGMIAQTLAIGHAGRIASLTSIMSTPGGRRYSFASLRALGALLERVPKEPAAQVEHFVRVFRFIAGNELPFDEARSRRVAESLVASKPSASGSARQFAAILESSGRRRRDLAAVRTPTLVVHGSVDPLLPVRGARAMARMMRGSELLVIEGMGHMIPASRYDVVIDAIARNAKRADPKAA
jgi:pimeloyl-ACP methyl ester carboxylesterase